ncbi:MAG TPA: protein kinase [Ktedonobacterales bacterium]|nr:protein kinase [Ktedonobacterales bacterium]
MGAVGPANGGSLVGRRLGDYHLQSLLGAGGMAEVYRALELPLGREVAVKVLPAALAADPNYVARFKTEARRVAQLRHPNIVEVYAFNSGDHGNLLYLVMPILRESLRDLLDQKGRLSIAESIRIVTEIASGLDVAHSFGLVHRDVKPENILLDKDGRALLTDFGIAREVLPHRQGSAAQTLAATGLPVGTPEYMSPEQLRGGSVDQRADVYALGSVLYELLTGRVPHEAETPYEVAALVLTEPITPPSQRNEAISPELEDVVMKALAKIPAQRFSDVRSFALALNVAAQSRRATMRSLAGGWQRKTMRIPMGHASANGVAEDLGGEADVEDLPTDAAASVGYRVAPGVRLRYRGLLILGIAVIILASLCGGGTLMFLNGSGPFGGTPSANLGGAVATQTTNVVTGATATDQASATPSLTATSQASPMPQPTATQAPTWLTFSPTPLTLVLSGSTCRATQTITNTSSQTLGWKWTAPQLSSSFRFTISGKTSGWPPQDMSPGIAPKASDTVLITVSTCQSALSSPITVTAVDSLNHTYSFVMRMVK